jgi:hypothetical protein
VDFTTDGVARALVVLYATQAAEISNYNTTAESTFIRGVY